MFEKDQQWSWDDAHKQDILIDLERDTNEVAGTEEENNIEEFEANAEPREIEPKFDTDEGDTSNNDNLPSQWRTRRPPVEI